VKDAEVLSTAAPEGEHRLRADALRNRERIVAAARDAFIAYGADAPLDEIARRAGVGNATLYRHFRLPCCFRGSLSGADEHNTPYPGYVSTCDGTKRKNLDTACALQGYGLDCSVSKRL
jgi:hypothetical protein